MEELDLRPTEWRQVPALPPAVAICDRLIPGHTVGVRLRECLQDWAWQSAVS